MAGFCVVIALLQSTLKLRIIFYFEQDPIINSA